MRHAITSILLAPLLLVHETALAADNAADQATVQFINQQALQCITSIKLELAGLSNRCPAFKTIVAEPMDAAKPTSKNAGCSMNFWRQIHSLNGKEVLDDNGVRLAVGIREHMPDMPTTQRYRATVGKKRVTAYYHLELGKNLEDMEAPTRAILDKNLQRFCALAEKMK
jgi:hypothetical protein